MPRASFSNDKTQSFQTRFTLSVPKSRLFRRFGRSASCSKEGAIQKRLRLLGLIDGHGVRSC